MKEEIPQQKNKITASQWRLFFLILVFGIVGTVYVALQRNGLKDSAALYIGLPLLLALGLSFTPKAKSATGATMKGTTIALLLSAIVFQEGYICILFAAPLFYAVGAFVAGFIDRARRSKDKATKLQAALVATLFAVLSLEGVVPLTTGVRTNEISVTKIISATPEDIRQQLSKAPRFNSKKPLFLEIFPYPFSTEGQGLSLGDERRILFVANKQIWWNRVQGELVLKISESTPDRIKFDIVKDESYLAHYLKWELSEISLEPLSDSQTKITWKLVYKRILDPAWYFEPMQKYAVKLAAQELIDDIAVPHP